MQMANVYTTTYPKITDAMIAKAKEHPERLVHGSELHEIVLQYFYGKRAVDSYDTERFINELVASGRIVVRKWSPTQQQIVHSVCVAAGWVPGTKLQYWYELK